MNEVLLMLLYCIFDLYFWVTMYDFIRVHLELKCIEKFKVVLVWVAIFFILVGINNTIKIPIINTIAFFSSIVFIEVFLYKGNIKRKILLAGFVCITVPLAEYITVSALSVINEIGFAEVLESLELVIFASSFSKILCGTIIKIVNKVTMKRRVDVTVNYWIGLFGITFCSVYLTYIILYFNLIISDSGIANKTIIAVACILFINMFVFYLYDYMLEQIEKNMKNVLYKQQAEYYEKQYEEEKEAEQRIRRLRHDIKNHLICIKEYAKKECYEELIDYINNISENSSSSYCKAASGNLVIDSILNYKINEAEKSDIQIEIVLEIPAEINIAHNDLCTILGNSLDNAIEASKLERIENRKINLIMKYRTNSMYICLSNFYTGKLKRDNSNRILTTKDNKEYHGIGLKSIYDAVENYNGSVEVNAYSEKFELEILLFMNKNI